ncbi:M28 family peptidase [Sphingobacterium alkalisoli]|uniref:M28 family peptidase n=1 Tax=Sphingobacterium alkalisoli TaxID=1874115 RepID=A0A4U0HB62_9SPHI|nr:M28 family peptidase [Sphingobacterium alkalisoli]TJY68644.1 M28 family peptidase [Sphingobacterium alkalisoli]GGH05098.1 hypothetical protein GCM10011418_01090 [Sphingobacterium alkalisoli]
MKRLLSLLFIIPAVYSCSIAQDTQQKYADLITVESSKKHLTTLSSVEFEGRGTGQKGGRKAAEYIAAEYKSYGLTAPVNGSYYQPVALQQVAYQVEHFNIDGETWINGKDFYVQGDHDFQDFAAGEIIFVGYGIQHANYDELKGIDVKGKVVLLINEGEPTDESKKSHITKESYQSEWSSSRFKRIQELTKLQPAAIFSTSSQVAEMLSRMKGRLTGGRVMLGNGDNTNRNITQAIPVINISLATANKLLAKANTSIDKFKEETNKSFKPTTQQISVPFAASMGVKVEKLNDPNVLGLLEGTDLKEEIIVISGHYDHDGILPDGTIFPGADDNGSGTVGVLELARAFSQAKKEGKGPRRSILFIGLAAEEKGLLGSKYYTENPIFPLANTVACLNLDMIGRIDDKHLGGNHNYIHAIGTDKLSSELKQITEAANRAHTQMEIDFTYDDPKDPMRLYYRSDHYNFALNGIPSAFFFSGLHPDYHTPNDTVDKIDFPMMVKREKLIFHITWEIAHRAQRLALDNNKE